MFCAATGARLHAKVRRFIGTINITRVRRCLGLLAACLLRPQWFYASKKATHLCLS